MGQNPKKSDLGPVEAISGDLIVAHGDSATDEPKKIRILSREARFMAKIPVPARAGGRAYGSVGPKRLRKKPLKLDRKSAKTKKNRTYPQNVQNFVRNRVATFFFDFGPLLTHFWPFY